MASAVYELVQQQIPPICVFHLRLRLFAEPGREVLLGISCSSQIKSAPGLPPRTRTYRPPRVGLAECRPPSAASLPEPEDRRLEIAELKTIAVWRMGLEGNQGLGTCSRGRSWLWAWSCLHPRCVEAKQQCEPPCSPYMKASTRKASRTCDERKDCGPRSTGSSGAVAEVHGAQPGDPSSDCIWVVVYVEQ